jgi:hypothetical protein
MRRGQESPADKSLKRPGREPWNGRKNIKVLLIIMAFTLGLTPGVLYQILIKYKYYLKGLKSLRKIW